MSIKLIEKIITPPQPHWVGNGFLVNGFFTDFVEANSPFLLFDYAASRHFEPSKIQRGVGSHPHRGFETVTIALQGSVTHHDSRGNEGTIKAGDVQWMTAGSGVLHQEYFEKEFNSTGGDFQMVQLWVNLPTEYKMTEPRYQGIESQDIPVFEANGVKLRIIAGEYANLKGPAKTFSPVEMFILELDKDANFEFGLEEKYTNLILNLEGEVEINQVLLPINHLLRFAKEGQTINFKARSTTKLLILSGHPLNEPIAHYGPFVMNTKSELVQAIDDFNSGKFGEL
jgi:quercetin 2,3-dioxygenase